MKLWKIPLFVLIIITFILLLTFPFNFRTASAPADFTTDVKRNYIEDLQPQREECYSSILLLGTLDNSELNLTSIKLQEYLNELNSLKNVIILNEVKNIELNESIELDILLINNTIKAIETKDERYLNGASEIYHSLLQYHHTLY
ncbi:MULTISPECIES: hypothetical protein [Solibacillus]|uniref:Uncharacterized protein n=1 Tax=Solibacillus merdavium TaxID=2762218 RepID=A0ABR8XNC1_9BACL|nr:hypothetical protein [Solibacillus merdavium]MBD8033433.1 hypothetical protein [Solibacillus merdavium]